MSCGEAHEPFRDSGLTAGVRPCSGGRRRMSRDGRRALVRDLALRMRAHAPAGAGG